MKSTLSEARTAELVAMAGGDVAIDRSFENKLRNWLVAEAAKPEVRKSAFTIFSRAELWFAVAALCVLALIGYGLWLPTIMDFSH